MGKIVATLFVAAVCCFAAASLLKRSPNIDTRQSAFIPAILGLMILSIDIMAVVCYAMYRLFS
jgi:hypothetical protein